MTSDSDDENEIDKFLDALGTKLIGDAEKLEVKAVAGAALDQGKAVTLELLELVDEGRLPVLSSVAKAGYVVTAKFEPPSFGDVGAVTVTATHLREYLKRRLPKELDEVAECLADSEPVFSYTDLCALLVWAYEAGIDEDDKEDEGLSES